MSEYIPRLTIDHGAGQFVDNDRGLADYRIECIPLGVIKQRRMSEDGRTQCASANGELGYPTKLFPWSDANFAASDHTEPESGMVNLPCASCKFTQFGSGTGASRPPRCNEQHTYVIMYTPFDGKSDSKPVTALLTVQKSALKNSKTYLGTFKRAKKPLYTSRAEFRLSKNKSNEVTWSVPEFRNLGQTDQEHWPLYSSEFRRVREIVLEPPTVDANGNIQFSGARQKPRDSFEDLL